MACDLFPVGTGATSCKENYSGTGTWAYLFFSEDVDTAAGSLVEDELTNSYSKFALKTGKKIYPINLKKQVNKVVDTSLGDNKGVSNVATIVVDKDLDLLAVVQRTVQNKPCGMLLKKAGLNSGCYILWNPTVDTKFEMTGDTGDSYDADSGSTWTVTSAPMPYARMTIPEELFAALTLAEATTTPST